MREQLEQLVSSLLYEGYALYPYTPSAAKNSTPTPFGIVYPPAYAAECTGAFDRTRLECVAVPEPNTTLTAHVRYLRPSGAGHEAVERQAQLGPTPLGERATLELEGGHFTLRSEPLTDELTLVRCCVHNTTEVDPGLDRGAALTRSMISVHIVVELSVGRFVSPLEDGRQSVNTWPVLATPGDDAVLGAAIVLPDHPQISAASRGNLFDNTEIEEALVLHVHALTDSEREQAAAHDPLIREMLQRTLDFTPDDILQLHSGLRPTARED
ncbi:MAG: hypothetical protein M3016_03605 [Actinomycetota bacterium]|nr:hypothetical protein [Actinomycetota bacterium]